MDDVNKSVPLLLRRIRWWFGGSIKHFLEVAGESAGEAMRESDELNWFNGFATSSKLARPFLTWHWLREIIILSIAQREIK